jgi:hypothetical protein
MGMSGGDAVAHAALADQIAELIALNAELVGVNTKLATLLGQTDALETLSTAQATSLAEVAGYTKSIAALNAEGKVFTGGFSVALTLGQLGGAMLKNPPGSDKNLFVVRMEGWSDVAVTVALYRNPTGNLPPSATQEMPLNGSVAVDSGVGVFQAGSIAAAPSGGTQFGNRLRLSPNFLNILDVPAYKIAPGENVAMGTFAAVGAATNIGGNVIWFEEAV